MDNSPETKKPAAAPASANANVTPSQPAAEHDYKTANIGKWKSKQEDFFAKQNQARSEKKAKQKATLKKLLPFAIACVALVVLGLGTWGVISLVNYLNRPTIDETATDPSVISGSSAEAIQTYQDYLQQVYDEALAAAMAEEGLSEASDTAKAEANAAVSDAMAHSASTEAGDKYRDAMRLAEMMVYFDTWQCDKILGLEHQINPDNLNLYSQYHYYVALQNCYQAAGNLARANELWRTVTELYGKVYTGESGVLREGVTE